MTTEYRKSTEEINPFVISDYVEFDSNGRALCPCCSPGHNNKSKTLSLVPNTDGAYKCFRGCTPKDIREALGQPKTQIIPTALTKVQPQKKVTVSEERVRENCLSILELTNSKAIDAFQWLESRGITSDQIKKYKLGLTRCRIGQKMTYAVTIPIPDGNGEYYQKKRVAPWDKELTNSPEYRPWKQYGIPKMAYFTLKPENAKETWLCEGEWDAIAMAELVSKHRDDVAVACFTCGCSSVPQDAELNRLPGKVTIFYDRNDKPLVNGTKPGEEGAKKVASALGDRAKIALVPMKDDCTVKGWDVSDAIKEGFIFESFERAATEASFVGEKYYSAFEQGLRTAKEVFDTAPDYVDWLVPDLLTSNELYCLAAEPRAGKSLFALGLAKAIASGGNFLDRPCQQGEVVYICKEDPDDKVKERLIAQQWSEEEMENVVIHNKFTLEDLPGLVQYVREKKPALIIMDTLSRVNPNAGAENSAEIVDTLAPLQNLAQQENVCVLVVHHTRKKTNLETDILDIFDSVRGSGAIRATCRGMLVVCKAKDSYRLAVENGRTAVQDLRIHLNVANLTWMLNGFWTPPTVNMTQKEIVLEWLQKHLQGTIPDISKATAIDTRYVHKILTRLLSKKIIFKRGNQQNAMYYMKKGGQGGQVDLLSTLPNLDSDMDTPQLDKNFIDPENSAQTDQFCNELLSSDQFDQKIEGVDNSVHPDLKDSECSVIYSNFQGGQKLDKSSDVHLSDAKVMNLTCSKNLPSDQTNDTTREVDHDSSNIANIENLSEFQEREDEIEGFWHKSHGYLKLIRLQGKRIYARRSGETKEMMCYWQSCTGKVELKADEES